MAYIDLTGRVFDKLTVLERNGSAPYRESIWKCLCECGTYTNVQGRHLRKGEIKSCGCTKSRIITGNRYGKWTVLEYSCSVKVEKGTLVYWWCQCLCGRVKEVRANLLTSGGSKGCRSCGRTTHGKSRTPEYARARNRARFDLERKLDVEWSFDKEEALKRFQPCCVVCGSTNKLCIDHVYPASKGFGLKVGNAIRLCSWCNLSKGNKLPTSLSLGMRDKVLSSAEAFKIAWENGFR